jgi:type IV pilus assembly protein PilQ
MQRGVFSGVPGTRFQRAGVLLGGTVIALTIAATLAADTHRDEAPASASAAARAELRAISTRLDGSRSQVLIEASEPVGFVTSQPDPLTVIVDLRNVKAGMMPPGILGPLPPVADVRVEEAIAGDGAEVARVRVQLAYAAKHVVRSSRNVIFIDVERAVVPRQSPGQSGAVVTSPDTNAPGAPVAPAVPVASAAPVAPVASVAPSQQPAPPPPSNDPAPPPADPKPAAKFQGHAVTFDFQDADLRAVLRTFSEISGLNFIIHPAITGRVDVQMKDVPWDQAFDILVKSNNLAYTIEGNVVRVAPNDVLEKEAADRRKRAEEEAKTEAQSGLRLATLPLSYAKASDLIPVIRKSGISQFGDVDVDPRTNTLIVLDLPDRIQTISELVKALDRPQPQVEIEARIVQTTRDFARAIGVEWGINGRVDPALGNTTNLAFPNRGSVTGRTGGVQGPTQGDTTADTGVKLGVPAATSALGIALGAVNGAVNLDVVLSQLESSGRGRLLSTPRVSTQNNIEAEMTQGIQIPIQTVANNTVTVSFKDAALTLKVTPQITASNTIIMRVFLENATPDFSRAVNGIPPIDTQRAVTTLLVGDGETTVIGGIYVSQEQATNGRVPLLHRIPLLGWLFQRDELRDASRELLIFITPRITKS